MKTLQLLLFSLSSVCKLHNLEIFEKKMAALLVALGVPQILANEERQEEW
jgi:hypothetical protein